MLKSTLIQRLADQKSLRALQIIDVEKCVNHILQVMCETLSDNGRIEIRDFGCFTLHYRAARKAHNPKNGVKLITKPKYRPHFKPGKGLRQRLNQKNCNHQASDSAQQRNSLGTCSK